MKRILLTILRPEIFTGTARGNGSAGKFLL